MWTFIKTLRKYEKVRDVEYAEYVEGERGLAPLVKRREYARVDERIHRIVGQYNDRTSIEYLKGIAHNLSFF